MFFKTTLFKDRQIIKNNNTGIQLSISKTIEALVSDRLANPKKQGVQFEPRTRNHK